MMRALPKLSLVLALLCALFAMFIPSPARATTKAKSHHCCAQMQDTAENEQPECPMHHSPTKQQQQDPSCCQLCAAGLALLYSSPAPFVYAQTGEESLVSLNARSSTLPHRPPVPPPRVAIS
jgi:hypothetical protein